MADILKPIERLNVGLNARVGASTTGFCLMKQLIFILFTFCVISNTYASDECLHRPGCEESGYTQTRKKCACFNKDVLPCPFNINDDNTVFCGDLDCTDKCKDLLPFYDGQSNTKKIIEQAGEKGLAAYATSLFYVGDKTGDFGQGKWYLPSIGEWMDFIGTDMSQVTQLLWSSGSIGDKMTEIEASLKTLATKGADAEILRGTTWKAYTTSSLYDNGKSWIIDLALKSRKVGYFHQPSDGGGKVRAALMIRNCFNPTIGGIPPKVGDVMYQDKTYGAVSDYNGSKTPVGVVVSVSETGRDVIILNLKDLTFNSETEVNNFNPDNPYGETTDRTAWGLQTVALTFGTDDFVTDLQSSCGCSCMFYGEETNCPKVDHCAKYDGSCSCSECEEGYLLAYQDEKITCFKYDGCFGCLVDAGETYYRYQDYKTFKECYAVCGPHCELMSCGGVTECYTCKGATQKKWMDYDNCSLDCENCIKTNACYFE